MVLDASEMTFEGLAPSNYAARVILAASEDETFCLVQESTGLGYYNYNPENGVMSISANEGKVIRKGDMLHVFNISELGDGLKMVIDGDEGHVRLVEMGGGDFALTYEGDETLTSAGVVELPIRFEDILGEQVDLANEMLAGVIPVMGQLTSGRSGVAPIDATYIYSWEGGRKHYLTNEASQHKLAGLLSGDIANCNIAENVDVVKPNAAAENIDTDVAKAVVEKEFKPVTQVPQVKASASKATSVVSYLTKDIGLSQKVVAGRVSFVGDVGGQNVLISALDNRIPVKANLFGVVVNDGEQVDVKKLDLIGKIDEIIENNVSQLKM